MQWEGEEDFLFLTRKFTVLVTNGSDFVFEDDPFLVERVFLGGIPMPHDDVAGLEHFNPRTSVYNTRVGLQEFALPGLSFPCEVLVDLRRFYHQV